MKKHLVIILTICLSASFLIGQAQEAEVNAPESKASTKGKTAEIEIQTSAVCDMCKSRIEHDLAYAKGVKYVELDSETKVVKVEYNSSKTDPDKIRTAISEIGYDADDVKADQQAHDKLPACCQKGTDPH